MLITNHIFCFAYRPIFKNKEHWTQRFDNCFCFRSQAKWWGSTNSVGLFAQRYSQSLAQLNRWLPTISPHLDSPFIGSSFSTGPSPISAGHSHSSATWTPMTSRTPLPALSLHVICFIRDALKPIVAPVSLQQDEIYASFQCRLNCRLYSVQVFGRILGVI
jgi:hypothetical protein